MKNKRILEILAVVAVITIIAVGILALKTVRKEKITMVLKGEQTLPLEVFSEYADPGIEVYINNIRCECKVTVDDSEVNREVLGIYTVRYSLDDYKGTMATRNVEIVDTTPPEIELVNDEIELLKGTEFVEPGYSASDNYDGDLTDKVVIESTINNNEIGDYEIKYQVSDESGNKAEIVRKVKVVTRNVSGGPSPGSSNENGAIIVLNEKDGQNQVRLMRFTNLGFNVVGHYDIPITVLSLVEKTNGKKYTFTVQIEQSGKYQSMIDLTGVENGVYKFLNEDSPSAVVNYLDPMIQIQRARVGDKLVTFSYPNNHIEVKVEPFNYIYDIAIEVGHGGSDPGASNGTITEKELNLVISLYEKRRYEEHGLRVYLDRMTNDVYGTVMGETSWRMNHQSAFAMGYYGSVSRYAYGNHHNSSGSSSANGWEMLVEASATKSDLAIEHRIAAEWNQLFSHQSARTRIYTRHFDSHTIYSKMNGEVYSFINYYAMQRMPYDLYNVRMTTYEGSFLSNPSEFQWYYLNGNWKTASEIKIKHYVEAMGLVYKKP